MKTVSIEIDEKFYKVFKDFLKILPKDSFRIIGEDIDELTVEERKEVYELKEKTDKGDFSDFENWDDIKGNF